MFAVEAYSLVKNCTKYCLSDYKFLEMRYQQKTGNHSNMIGSTLPLPPM